MPRSASDSSSSITLPKLPSSRQSYWNDSDDEGNRTSVVGQQRSYDKVERGFLPQLLPQSSRTSPQSHGTKYVLLGSSHTSHKSPEPKQKRYMHAEDLWLTEEEKTSSRNYYTPVSISTARSSSVDVVKSPVKVPTPSLSKSYKSADNLLSETVIVSRKTNYLFWDLNFLLK